MLGPETPQTDELPEDQFLERRIALLVFLFTHAARAQAADKPETAGQPSGKLRFGFRGLSGEGSAVSWTEGEIVRISLLACGAGLHERR